MKGGKEVWLSSLGFFENSDGDAPSCRPLQVSRVVPKLREINR